MENTIIVGDQNPELQDGDVLAVESVAKQGISWRDIFPVISSAFTLIVIIDRIGSQCIPALFARDRDCSGEACSRVATALRTLEVISGSSDRLSFLQGGSSTRSSKSKSN